MASIPDHPYKIIFIWGSVSGKKKWFIKADKLSSWHWQKVPIHKRSIWSKITIFVNKRNHISSNPFEDLKPIIEFTTNGIKGFYKNTEKHNSGEKLNTDSKSSWWCDWLHA